MIKTVYNNSVRILILFDVLEINVNRTQGTVLCVDKK